MNFVKRKRHGTSFFLWLNFYTINIYTYIATNLHIKKRFSFTTMAKRTSFNWSDDHEPHKSRTKIIIKEHPEIRSLIGRNPYTFLVILLCVGVQMVLTY